MKKRLLAFWITIAVVTVLFSSCNIIHQHTFGAYQFDGVRHFTECSCGYRISESSSKHIDEDRNETCDICNYAMKYEIHSLEDLSWYLLYYYEMNHYEYLDETNMKFHSIHDMNFKNTITYNDAKTRVRFETPNFNEYLTSLPRHKEHIKSNTEYYFYHKNSTYSKPNASSDYYLFDTQEQIRYGLTEQCCEYERESDTVSKFKTSNDFYDPVSSSTFTKKIYTNAEEYEYVSNDTVNTIVNHLSKFISVYLHVEFTDHGEIVLPEVSYFDNVDVKTADGIVYFKIEKTTGETFWGEDLRYSIEGEIHLATYALSYNMKESRYLDGEISYYNDYDYDLILTNEAIAIEFDLNGECEEVYIGTR